jgi:hypothetical protein
LKVPGNRNRRQQFSRLLPFFALVAPEPAMLIAAIVASTIVSASQSWIDPGTATGGDDGRTGLVAGVGVVRAPSDGADTLDTVLGDGPDFMAGMLDTALGGGSDFMGGVLDAALGGGSDFMEGVSTGPSSLCGGLSRGNGGLPGGG